MKTPGWLLRRRWFLVAVLSLLVAFGPMMLTASPAHAESTYDDYLAMLQQWRPQEDALLAAYQQWDAGTRAYYDALLEKGGVFQNQLSFYNALSAGNRAELDKEARRATGYTFSQLAQGTSTLPGLVKLDDILIAALPHFSGGGAITPTPITPTPITPTPITPTPITPTPITPTPITPTPITPTPIAPTPIAPTPIQTGPPYDDALSQLGSARQQLDQLLAAYQSADADAQAAMDAAMASGMLQALHQVYGSLSASDRAHVDEETRRLTGYTFVQLMQGASTVPGLLRMMDILMSAIQNLSGGGEPAPTTTPPATTTEPETPVEPPATSSPSGIISVEPPAQGGEVYLGSGQLKLGWVLYGRTDLSDEEAQAIYDGKADVRGQEVDASIVVATEGLEKAKRQLEMYEKITEENDQQKIISALKEDLAEAKNETEEANKELGILLAKELAKGLEPHIEGAIGLWDNGAAIKDILVLVGKTDRKWEDWGNAAAGLVTLYATVSDAAGFKLPGQVQSICEISAGSIFLYLSDKRADALANSITQAGSSREDNLKRLEGQVLMRTIELEHRNREKKKLAKGYL